jgi:pyruvate kinase
MVKTKIIATLGPASSQEKVLRKMFLNGLDAVRLNFSHGTHRSHIKCINIIRALNKKLRRHIRIMQDLEGYRIRVGALKQPLELKKRSQFYLTQERGVHTRHQISFDYQGSLERIKKGTLIYIDDGRIVVEVISCEEKRLKVKVITPGILKSRKGVNMPGVDLEFEALSAKDKRDVAIGIAHKVDYIAQSFVRDAHDLRLLKEIVLPRHPACKIYAKIENTQALVHLDSIIDEADGIIVARGDLGICVPIYKVPVIQKEIIRQCRLKNKPVMVATQMLDSMTNNTLPTRAEVSDVANAILDGAHFLLLSSETAVGKHPHRVIWMMNQIIKDIEAYQKKL